MFTKRKPNIIQNVILCFLIFIAVYLSIVVMNRVNREKTWRKRERKTFQQWFHVQFMISRRRFSRFYFSGWCSKRKKNQIIKLHFYGWKSIGKDFYCFKELFHCIENDVKWGLQVAEDKDWNSRFSHTSF